jgi:hypothetical protein
MFRKTQTNKQINAFSSPGTYFGKSSSKFYESAASWHNQFRKNVVNQIDETIFEVLFDEKNGAPNASVRILVGMMILKEGHGWSDEQLFEQCNYNLLVRSALGLLNMEDAAPVPSTYYLFRHNIVAYNGKHSDDLFKKCQEQITRNQILEFDVSGKKIRMDSKLLGSNIAWYSRYELIHETLRLFMEERQEAIHEKSLSQEELELIKSIEREGGNKVVYRSTREEIGTRLVRLGELMWHFTALFKDDDQGEYQTLKSVFEQQYSVESDQIVLPKANEEISAQSIQSPHDRECTYRNKDGNKVKGYSVNVTETCDEPEKKEQPALNLITDIQVDTVSTADNDFLQAAVKNSSEVLPEKIESINADGAYHSPENQDYCKGKEINLLLSAIQGSVPRYDLELDESDKLKVTDLETKQIIIAQLVKQRKETGKKKWRISTEEGKYRYFDQQSIANAALRRKLKDIPIEELNRRNNVEATIFQMGYHYSNDKSRYRTLAKHKLWAYSRALWVNHVRITKYVGWVCQNLYFSFKHACDSVNYYFYMQIYANILFLIRCELAPPKNSMCMAF